MIIGKALDVVAHGVEPARRDDAGLAHRTADLTSQHSSPLCPRRVGHDERTDRRTETLGQAHRERGESAAVLAKTDAGGDCGIPDASTVAVHGNADGGGDVDERIELGQSPCPAARAHMGVLNRQGAGGDPGVVAGLPGRIDAQLGGHRLRRKHAVVTPQRPCLNAADGRK